MRAARVRARSTLRSTMATWLLLGIVVGLTAGAAMASAVAARRTDAAYPRFVKEQRAADVIADIRSRDGRPLSIDEVLAMPHVEDAGQAILAPVRIRTEDAREIVFPDAFTIVTHDGRFGSSVNRVKILEGRRPDQGRADEVSVSFSVAEQFDLRVGERLQVEVLGNFGPAPVVETIAVTVAGIGVMPGELQTLAGASTPSILFTRAFFERFRGKTPLDPSFAILFRNGPADLASFEAHVQTLGAQARPFFQQRRQTTLVTRSTRVQSVALWLLAAFTALVTAAVLAQTIARQAATETADHGSLRAVGFSRRDAMGAGVLASAAPAAVAAVVACVVAWLASPLGPAGLVRVVEPSPGRVVDAVVLVAGGLVLLAVAAGAAAVSYARAYASATPSARAAGGDRPSRAAEAVARAGASAPVVAGIRLALQPGRPQSGVPVRSAVLGASFGIVAIVAALTFNASKNHLIATPDLAGWGFDMMLTGSPRVPEAVAELERRGMVAAKVEGMVPSLLLNDGAALIDGAPAMQPGAIAPAVAAGRVPRAPDEIALGRDTMRALRAGIGSEVRVAIERFTPQGPQVFGPVPFRVVGRLIMPFIAGNLGGAGEGAAMTVTGVARIDPAASPDTVFVRLRDRARVAAATNVVRGAAPDVFTWGRRDAAQARDVARLGSTPLMLGGLLVLLASATIAHTLVTSVRRRRRDLAVLRTIGFERSQVRSAVRWQASTLVIAALCIGVPVGIVAGRWGWLAFADALGVVPVARVPLAATLLIVPAVLVVGNLIAAVPARAASRIGPADALRSE